MENIKRGKMYIKINYEIGIYIYIKYEERKDHQVLLLTNYSPSPSGGSCTPGYGSEGEGCGGMTLMLPSWPC